MITALLILAMLQPEPMGVYDLINLQQGWLYVNEINANHNDAVAGRPMSRSQVMTARDRWAVGDFNGDMRTDLEDFAIVSKSWAPL